MAKYILELTPGLDPEEPNYLKLGISEDRISVLDSQIEDIFHRANANDPELATNTLILKAMAELADTLGELVYCIYVTGMSVSRAYQMDGLFDTPDDN